VSAGDDPRATLRRLYRGIDGFEIPRTDARNVARSKGSPTYGELMTTATLRLLTQLELGPADVFVDLGAGVGKVVMLAASGTAVGRARGVELSARRVGLAREALELAEREGLVGFDQVEFVEGDMLGVPLADATVIYTCSTAFSDTFMGKLHDRLATLPRLRKLVSLQDFEDPSGFELVEIYRLDASWKRRTKVYVYEPV